MTYIKIWEEFEKCAERLYVTSPDKVRCSVKYAHCQGFLTLKVTDDITCLLYKMEIQNDLRKMDKFLGNMMKDMVSG